MCAGHVVVRCSKASSHNGINITASGLIKLQLSARSVGLFEAFYSSIKPLELLSHEALLVGPGKLTAGENHFPFEFGVDPVGASVRQAPQSRSAST